MMRVIDLHCDTVGEAYDAGLDLSCGGLDINSGLLRHFDEYIPVTAVWSRKDLSGEQCYSRFLAVCGKAEKELAGTRHILAVEGGSLLCGDISRLDVLARKGVRIFTLMWSGINELGGAHDTDIGLTGFGREVVSRCFELGIVPDVSHASDKSFYDVREMAKAAGRPFVASHSNSRALWDHRRNLTDDMYLDVCASGGVAGVSLEPTHLGRSGGLDDAVGHILRYFSLDPDGVCLGCDFDGRTCRRPDTENMDCIQVLRGKLASKGLSETQIEKIFYTNASNFLKANKIEY